MLLNFVELLHVSRLCETLCLHNAVYRHLSYVVLSL
jgi:hypothetical protein